MGSAPETVFRVSERQASATLDDEAIILGLDSGEYFGLSGVGRLVWDELRSPQSVVALERAILARYAVEEQVCHDDLQRFLATLEAEGLIRRVTT